VPNETLTVKDYYSGLHYGHITAELSVCPSVRTWLFLWRGQGGILRLQNDSRWPCIVWH